jgi:tetratricopeptide (TPR) repeat protein
VKFAKGNPVYHNGLKVSRLTRFSVAILISIALSGGCFAQRKAQMPNEIDASPALFTVMAAINAVGYDGDLNSPSNHPLRNEIRAALKGKHLDSLDELKKFFDKNRLKDWDAELAQYISFALCLDGAPDFHFRAPDEIPPDVVRLIGLEQILPRFYKEAGIEQLWRRAQPDFDKVISAYHEPVTRALLEANSYLRNPTSGYSGRRFVIYIDLLSAPNQIQTRNYKDDYFVVVTPSQDLRIDQIQYAYFHYLLDPLSLKFAEALNKKKDLSDWAQAAPALEDVFKSDYLLLASSSLIQAIESRLARGSAKQEIIDKAMREGFVYTAAFADALPAYEKQEQSMRYYFPTLVAAIDMNNEEARVSKIEFVHHREVRTVHATTTEASGPELTGAAKTLQMAEDLYDSRELDLAKQFYEKVLQETPEQPMHTRAYYGLARIAALQRDPELAEKLFQKTLELSPDPSTKSWVYLYLGRLEHAAREDEEAMKYYRLLFALDGASPKARSAAQKDVEGISRKEK